MKIFILAISLAILCSSPAKAVTKEEELAVKLKNMFFAGKVFIFKQQDVINSKTSSKAAFSPKNIMTLIKREYKKIFKEKWPVESHPYIREMSKAMRTVMSNNLDLIHDSSKGYKGFIAAVFAHQVATEFSKSNKNVSIKFTAPVDQLRNPRNTPDSWEKVAMSKFALSSWEKNLSYSENRAEGFRYIYPLYYDGVCLPCHGDPKYNPSNEGKDEKDWVDIDISGYKMEGMKLDALAGGISIVIREM